MCRVPSRREKMTNLELIDRLCAVSTTLMDIVLEQQTALEQLRAGAENGLREKTEEAQRELDLLEYSLRRAGDE